MGLYPAWQSSRADLVEGLKDGGRAISASRGQQRFRRGLVGGTGWPLRYPSHGRPAPSRQLRPIEPAAFGFRPRAHLWVGGHQFAAGAVSRSEARARFVERLLAELKTFHGVDSASISDGVPLNGNSSSSPYARVDDDPVPLINVHLA